MAYFASAALWFAFKGSRARCLACICAVTIEIVLPLATPTMMAAPRVIFGSGALDDGGRDLRSHEAAGSR
jgi:hypothetical protein